MGEQEINMEQEPIIIGAGAVDSVNGMTGDVVLTTSDIENTSDYQNGTQVETAINTALSANGGKSKELSSSDYNWNTTAGSATEPYDAVALWLLPAGIYYKPSNSVTVLIHKGSGGSASTAMSYLVCPQGTMEREIVEFGQRSTVDGIYLGVIYIVSNSGTNSTLYSEKVMFAPPYNGLDSDSTKRVLSAKAGKTLADRIGDLTTLTTTARTSAVAAINELDTDKQEKLTAGSNITISNNTISATDTTYSDFTGTDGASAGTAGLVPAPATTDTDKYLKSDGTWATVSGGGSGPTVVQTPGTSTTDVMSQNAVGEMLFTKNQPSSTRSIGIMNNNDGKVMPSTGVYNRCGGNSVMFLSGGWTYATNGLENVIIGYGGSGNLGPSSSSSNPNYITAIGSSASCNYGGGVALGAYSKVSAQGEMNIGSTNTQAGYNNSNYRLLSGVHDPVNAHDAATKGYVDSHAGPTVVQTTGTSTTDVMSQKAVTDSLAPTWGGYQGKNLENEYTIEELSAKVQSGDFSGLHIGDYITKTVKVGSNTERELDFVIAGFDYFLGMGDTELTTHHLVMVPDTGFYETMKMNDTNTTTGGYYGSQAHGIASAAYTAGTGGSLTNVVADYEMFLNTALGANDGEYTFTHNGSQWQYDGSNVGANLTSYGITYSGTPVSGDEIKLTFAKGNLEPYRQAIYTAFGNSHILTHRTYMTTSTSAGQWHNARVELMNECMVYGSKQYANNEEGERFAPIQLPYFAMNPQKRVAHRGKGGSRGNAWLSSFGSSSGFCAVSNTGYANYAGASYSDAVRPYFLFA